MSGISDISDSISLPAQLTSQHSFKERKTLTIHCHDRLFRNVTAVDEDGEVIFRVKSGRFGQSLHSRRSVYDAAGELVMESRYKFDHKGGWTVECPNGRQLARTIQPRIFSSFSDIDMTVRGDGTDNPDVILHMRGKDRGAICTLVKYQDLTVAEIIQVENNVTRSLNRNRDEDWTTWRVEVIPFLDLSLIMSLSLVRAELMHSFRK